jgi:hypothetical protein
MKRFAFAVAIVIALPIVAEAQQRGGGMLDPSGSFNQSRQGSGGMLRSDEPRGLGYQPPQSQPAPRMYDPFNSTPDRPGRTYDPGTMHQNWPSNRSRR